MRHQKGIALLTAIVLVALATIIAAAIAYQSAMTARRGSAVLAYDQSILAAQAAEALAAYVLKQNTSATVYPGDHWADLFGPVEIVPGVTIEAQLEDASSRFNLNNLLDKWGRPNPGQVAAFRELLQNLRLETIWADKLVDWIDPDVQPQPDGAEDDVYTALQPPYHPPNIMITSVSELLALPEFGRDRYLKLAPYVVALPAGTTLNVCTASGVVLDSIAGATNPGYDEYRRVTDQMNEERKKACWPPLQVFTRAVAENAQNPLMVNALTASVASTSSYFHLTTVVTIGTTQFTLYSLLFKQGGTVRTLLRSQTAD